MTKRILVLPALFCAALAVSPAQAQSVLPISLDARVGAALPTGDFADGAKTGFTAGAAVHYQLNPVVSLYGGYEYARFAADSASDVEGVDAHFTDTGFRAGARFAVPLAGMTGIHPWVEGGATLNHATVSVSDNSGAISFSAKRALGFEAGLGLDFAAAPKVTVSPGVRYRSHDADFRDVTGEPDSKVTVSYFTADLAVRIKL